jgi:hypothetical protein
LKKQAAVLTVFEGVTGQGATSSFQSVAYKKPGPQSHSHKEKSSADSLHEPGSRFSPVDPSDEKQPSSHSAFLYVGPCRAMPFLTHGNYNNNKYTLFQISKHEAIDSTVIETIVSRPLEVRSSKNCFLIHSCLGLSVLVPFTYPTGLY